MTGHSIWLSAAPNCTALFFNEAMGDNNWPASEGAKAAKADPPPAREANNSPAGVSTTMRVLCGNTVSTSASFAMICSLNFGLKPHRARQHAMMDSTNGR
jgi:hypothetical protein